MDDNWDERTGVRSAGAVETTREAARKITAEQRHCLSILPMNVPTFVRALRGHREVALQLNWVPEVVFGRNQSRASAGHAAANPMVLSSLSGNILRTNTPTEHDAEVKQSNAAVKPY